MLLRIILTRVIEASFEEFFHFLTAVFPVRTELLQAPRLKMCASVGASFSIKENL
jgi:hypothetical protein